MTTAQPEPTTTIVDLLADEAAASGDEHTSVIDCGQQPPTPQTAAIFQPAAEPQAPAPALDAAEAIAFGGLSDDQIADLLNGLQTNPVLPVSVADDLGDALRDSSAGHEHGAAPETADAVEEVRPPPGSSKRRRSSSATPKQHHSASVPVRKRQRQPFTLTEAQQEQVRRVMDRVFPFCHFTRPTFVNEWLQRLRVPAANDLPGTLRNLLGCAVDNLRSCQVGELVCLLCWAMISCDYRHVVHRVFQDLEEQQEEYSPLQKRVLRQLRMYAASNGNFMRSSVVHTQGASLSLLPCFRETLVPRRDHSIYPPAVRLPDLFEEPRLVRFGWVNPIC